MLLRNSIFYILLIIISSFQLLGQFPNSSQGRAMPQQLPTYKIGGIRVEGNRYVDAETIISISGLRVGEEIRYPVDEKVQEAVRNLWSRNQFSYIDVKIDRVTDFGLFLIIEVKEFTRYSQLIIENNQELDDDDIEEVLELIRGDILSNYELAKIEKKVEDLYAEEGYNFAKVEATLEDTDTAAYSSLLLYIEEGLDFKINSISFIGNENFDDKELEGAFEETKTKAWWQIWKSNKYNEDEYKNELQKVVGFYRKNGYMNAEVIRDTVYYNEEEEKVDIEIEVFEGNQVFVRNIEFEGNTVYPDYALLERLEFEAGDPYDQEKFQLNLLGNEKQTDAFSLYMNNGYLQANMEPDITKVAEDTVDIIINVYENDRFRINKVIISGNDKTKDKVIRRELFTRPGEYFDRSAIIRSVRALGVLNYFNPEALKPDVQPSGTDNTSVDIIYNVEERSTDTFNAQLGFAGVFGLTGALGFTFNNFSITEPLKGGGGQIFNFNWEFGQLNRFRTFSLGFQEPWLFDKPTTLGFNLFDSFLSWGSVQQQRTGISVNIGRRLRWPDDYWRIDGRMRFQLNDVGEGSAFFRSGRYTEITPSLQLSRASINNLFFPSVGSRFSIESNFALGALGIGNTDYLKNDLSFEIYNPLWGMKGQDRLVLMMSTQFGYITGIESDTTISPIELYRLGGNGLSGFAVTPLRGYRDDQIGSRGGSKILAKHTAELRFAISLDPMPIFVYGFGEAGNVWDNLQVTDPFNLKRSAGVGIQLLVNPIGIIGFSYGYGFDPYQGSDGPSGWVFLFHLGQR